MLDPTLAVVIVVALVTIIALVAITYGQKGIAELALKVIARIPDKSSLEGQEEKGENVPSGQVGSETTPLLPVEGK